MTVIGQLLLYGAVGGGAALLAIIGELLDRG
jgi:hypothetical protein